MTALQKLVYDEKGIRCTIADLEFAMSNTSDEVMQKLGLHDLHISKWIEYINKSTEVPKPFNGVEKTISQLHQQNKKLGIVTSKTKNELSCDFNKTVLPPLFQAILTADDTQHPKPDPDLLIQCLNALNVSPEKTLYIGDTHYDSLCAKAAGVDFALALWGINRTNIEANHRLTQPSDLLTLT